MSSFGDVTYADPAAAGTQPASNGASAAADAPVEVFDPNDPQLTSEALDVNPNADAYAAPPTLPDGKWRVKLTASDVKGAGTQRQPYGVKKDRDGHLYLYTALKASVIEHQQAQFDGIELNDYFVDSKVGKNGASRVSTLLVKLNQKLPSPATHKALMDQLLATLASEPELGVETAWEADCQACAEAADKSGGRKPRSVRGMHNFPQKPSKDAQGRSIMVHSNQMPCAVSPAHGPMVGRPRIMGYLSLEELGKFGK